MSAPGLPWMKVWGSVIDHHKTVELAEELHVQVATSIGYLVMAWWWTKQNYPDGRVRSPIAPLLIEKACQWRGKKGRLVEAMIKVRFLDLAPDGLDIHDWGEHQGKVVEQAERDRIGALERREKRKQELEFSRRPTVGRLSGDRRPQEEDGEEDRDLDQVTLEEDRSPVAVETAPSPPPEISTDPQLNTLWQALETASGAVFGTKPRDSLSPRLTAKLEAFWEGHERDLAWCLDTQANWMARDRAWVAKLNPPGAPEVLIDLGQWKRFKRGRPSSPAPSAPPGSAEDVWGRALQVLRDAGKYYALNWLIRLVPTGLTEDTLTLEAPDHYLARTIEDTYAELILEALEAIGMLKRLEICTQPEAEEASAPAMTQRFIQTEAVA